jgi:hypothetical protein
LFTHDLLTLQPVNSHHQCQLHAENIEPYQIMKYGPSERYVSHVDYYDRDSRFFGNDVTKFGGQRIMTALLYLTTCKGGETVFKKALKNNTVGLNSCANAYVTPPA